jgi:lysophospholipase L1-like esterase
MINKTDFFTNLILLILVTLTLASLCELIATAYFRPYFYENAFADSNMIAGKVISIKPYTYFPGTKDLLNNEGVRGNDFSKKKGGKVRIAVLGDSFTYGYGLEDIDETYPRQLEAMLNGNGTSEYEVMNFGLPGMNSMDINWMLSNKVPKYFPDIVIYGFNINDLEYKGSNTDIEYCIPMSGDHIYSYEYFRIRTDNIITKIRQLRPREDDSAYFERLLSPEYYGYSCFTKIIKNMKNLSAKNNITLIAFDIPVPSFRQTEESIYPMFDNAGIPTISGFTDNFDRELADAKLNYSDIVISEDNDHFNQKGNKIIASLLYDFLTGKGYVK